MAMKYIDKSAIISPDQRYRYVLTREWRGTHNPDHWFWLGEVDGAGHQLGEPLSVVFIMLNPSTADGTKDDPTIRKCVGFARQWYYEKLVVINLFAYRATQPIDLKRLDRDSDPVGPHNHHHLREVLNRAGRVVCAWGHHGSYLGQDQTMMDWLDEATIQPWCLGLTDSTGQPKHPLFVPYNARLVRYNPL
jgi:hypothetical protein